MSDTLENLILKYKELIDPNPHNPDCWELKEYITSEVRKMKNLNDLRTTSLCWIATRIYFSKPDLVCKYSNKEALEELDKKALEWLKRRLGE